MLKKKKTKYKKRQKKLKNVLKYKINFYEWKLN